MKQLIISVILAVCLVGCGEKPKFSINKDDTVETYANNLVFTKIESGVVPDPHVADAIVYKFTGVPESIYGIKTNDLDILGGYVSAIIEKSSGSERKIITITAKGKKTFDELKSRINQVGNFKSFSVADTGIDKENTYGLTGRTLGIGFTYNPFIDSVTINIQHYIVK